MLVEKRKLGRRINEMSVGERLIFTDKMEDKELLLYLGLTDDANPLYIQHDYASKTKFKAPIVPAIMINGILFSSISKYFPGPGSYINDQHLSFLHPIYHGESIRFCLEVKEIKKEEEKVVIAVEAQNEEKEIVITGNIIVSPPVYKKSKLRK
ncbi:MAG: MaoC/PaaZ C-terminal domain-containing protein [Bacillaceae bacterium]